VNGDPIRFVQVLANLLTNAAKYTDPGGRISLDARREEGWVKLSVVDDGSGISPELMPLLFEPFVQGPQTIARARGGLGLGLAIVRSLVELHGGGVSVSSAGPGRGSEFVVRLPWFEPTEAEVDVVPAPAALRAPDIQGASRRSRVLVVDDNVDAAEMLSMALQMAGWETDVAHDGLEALKKAASFDPDAVVIDIGLPIMDGYEVGRRLREAQAKRAELRPLRLVAVTGYGQEADRQQSAASGIDVHLVKPVDLDVLSAALVQPATGGDAPAARSG
jgi:CheY-like chemotaxis protein